MEPIQWNDGKIIIDHDGLRRHRLMALTEDPATRRYSSHDGRPVVVAPKLAGDNFVDSADPTDETASLYYVETGLTDTTVGATDGDPDDGIDQTKLFLERSVNQGVTTYTRVAVIEVTIDNATAFKHIHYGLWNGLSRKWR